MSGLSTSPGMRDLVLHLARHHRGLALLHLADLECTAVTLGVDALTVVEARDALETPEGRAQLIAAVRQARLELASNPGVPAAPGSEVHQRPPRTARELVRAAAEHVYGLGFLSEGNLESVAVIFHVHPNLVLRARALLERHAAIRARHPKR